MHTSQSLGVPGSITDLLHQAQPLLQQLPDTQVDESVMNAVPLAMRGDDAEIGKPLQLVRHSLRFHTHRVREVRDAKLVRSNQSMQETQSTVVREHLEHPSQPPGLNR